MIHQHSHDSLDLAAPEPVVLADVDKTGGTVQIEYGFMPRANYMDVGRPVIVRVDDNPKPVKSEDRRRRAIVSDYLTAWVFTAKQQIRHDASEALHTIVDRLPRNQLTPNNLTHISSFLRHPRDTNTANLIEANHPLNQPNGALDPTSPHGLNHLRLVHRMQVVG